MKSFKKITAILFVSLLALSFSGCRSTVVQHGQAVVTASAAPTTDTSGTESSSGETQTSTESDTQESKSEEESSQSSQSEASSGSTDDVKNYVYFDNSEAQWQKVCAYWWDAGVTNKVTGEAYVANADGGADAQWPGLDMEKVDGSDVYRIALPVGATKIIFCDGILDKDVKDGAEAHQTDNLEFSDSSNAGQVYKLDLSVDPDHGGGKMKSKLTYTAGSWSDYAG